MTDEPFLTPPTETAQIARLGGEARAKSLTRDQRRESARRAVEARWAAQGKLKILRATHEGPLTIGDSVVPCAVLEDGTRVMSRIEFIRTIGRTGKAKGGRRYDQESRIPVFLTAANLKPFLSKELLEDSAPVPFRPQEGGVAMGYKATLLPAVCDVFLNAAVSGALTAMQQHIAERCRILTKAFASVGITALVDEATGYQDFRARDALAKILEKFVAKDLQRWVSTFPPDFYKQMFRLRRIPYTGELKKPQYVGHLTNDLVYKRLAPGLLAELRTKNPVTASGRRKTTHTRWLTVDHGHPKLLQHLGAVTALMTVSDTWDGFYGLLDRALPVWKSLPLFDSPPQ